MVKQHELKNESCVEVTAHGVADPERYGGSRSSTVWIKDPLAIHLGRGVDSSSAARGIVVDLSSGTIVELVPAGGEPTGGPTSLRQIVDASEHVVTPGLVNSHHHFYQTLTRAWAPVADLPLFGWLTNLYPVWARLTPRALEVATTVAMAELLESGCTTTSDHHYLFPDGLENAIDIQVEVVRRLGMRATLTRGSMSLGENEGGLPPQNTVQDADVILEDSRRLVNSYHERGPGAQVQIALAPCSPFSVTTHLMRDSADLAQELDVRLHTHLAETLDEKRTFAGNGLASERWITWIPWDGSEAERGWPTAYILMTRRSPGSVGRASLWRTARRLICGWPPGLPEPSISRRRELRWDLGSTGRRPTTHPT